MAKIKKISSKAKTLDDQKLTKITGLVRDRMTTISDFEKYAKIFFAKGKEKPPQKQKCQNAKAAVESISAWDEKSISQLLDQWIAKNKIQPADFKNTLRLAVFADNTPPIYQSLAVLKKEEILKRIEDALKKADS